LSKNGRTNIISRIQIVYTLSLLLKKKSCNMCSRFLGINPLIRFELSIFSFELSIFIRGKGNKWVKTLMRSRSGGWFRIGKVLSTLNDFGTPKEPLT